MTERTVTIKLGLEDQIGNRLLEIRKQRDALLTKSKISLNVDAEGMEQAQRAAVRARQASSDALKDMSLLGAAITTRGVNPTAQFSAALGGALIAVQRLGPGIITALQRTSAEFEKQRTLAQFWGKEGYLILGSERLKSSLSSFLSGSGGGFSKWLVNVSSSLSSYRTGLVAASAAMIGLGAAAGLTAAGAQRYIAGVFGSNVMYRKHGASGAVLEGAQNWTQEAQSTPWSPGRESRASAYMDVLSKNPQLSAEIAQRGIENVEKYFFANSELLKKNGIDSAEAMASIISQPDMGGMGAVFDSIFGLDFSRRTVHGRFGRVGAEAGKLDMGAEVAERPEQAMALKLSKSVQSLGDVTVGPLMTVLGTLLKIADAAGKIPGLPQVAGWGIVLTGMAAAGLTVLSMLAGLAPALGMVIGLISKASLVTKGLALAQWALNIAMSANPIGLAVVGIAALIAGLIILEKKFGLVGKAWAAMKAGAANLGNAFKEGGAGGVIKLALGALVANSPQIKLIMFIVDFLKKVWQNSETLNKLLSSGVTIWQQIGQIISWAGALLSRLLEAFDGMKERIENFFGAGNEEQKAPLTPTEEQEMVDWAKDLRKAGGSKVFDFGRESGIYELALEEARTGVPQELPIMQAGGKEEYDRLVNTYRNRLANPSAGLGDVAPEGSTSNPFYNPTYTNAIPGPGGIEVRTKPAEEITGSQDVEGGLQMLARKGYDFLFGPKMAAGGPITGTGSLIGHAGEEVSPASAVIGAKTTLERMNEAAAGGQGGSITLSPQITVNIDKVSSDVDMKKSISQAVEEADRVLLFRLQRALDDRSSRTIGYMRG